MSDTLVLYVASPDDDPVIEGVAAWVGDGVRADEDRAVTIGGPVRYARVFRGPDNAVEGAFDGVELRQVFVGDRVDGIAATINLAEFLRGRGMQVIVDPDNPRLLAAAQAAHIAAA